MPTMVKSQCEGSAELLRNAPMPLFDKDPLSSSHERLQEGAMLLTGSPAAEELLLVHDVARLAQPARFRPLFTPAGDTMSAGVPNCGVAGWFPDRSAY